jgi:hypothetical protein
VVILRIIEDVGLFDRLGLSRTHLRGIQSVFELGVKSPWAEGSLSAILWSDLVGRDLTENWPLTRDQAMTIPAVAKARNLLVSTIAPWPLVDMKGEERSAEQPTWLYRTNGIVSPYERMVWTIDDGIFYGASLWLTERGAADGDGRRPILEAMWCPPSDWCVTDGHILVNEQEVDEDEVLLINFPFEGLLNIAQRTLRGAIDTEKAWTGRMRNPIPLIELRVTDDTNLSQEEVEAYVAAWASARRQENGAVNFTPPGIEIHTHGEVKADLFQENRNAVRTDVGSFVNVRAAMLDGTTGVDSLTYTTKDGEKNLFYELDVPFWSDPVEAALSQDKYVPRGHRVRFDKYAAFNPPVATGIPTED